MFKKFMNHEKGITGLETAIILIAFVVVAAVFAYTALSAGLFATQKAQESVYSGLKEAQSTLELRGSVIATDNTTGAAGKIQQLSFIVSNVLGGAPIDFTQPTETSNNDGTANSTAHTNVVVINYIDQGQVKDDLFWTITKLGNADSDDLLESNERFQINIGSDTVNANGGNLIDALTTDLSVKTQFTLEILTPVGAILQVERTTPAWIDQIVNLR